ncbi:DUF4173 domain-containing protein [Cytophagaceae bacterium YF14B1]|uniref:DUF4173 domain-containing protein n=1 Tax=Xanthocytophaga flava TaxID=3048013 RepID=A0AAE3QNB6_9BACT|nr:DUF4173 domain-containing protein [Xanthocytophaga flavus]MDJ1480056.1 DUF4173 domain-containing protein [Xanthocytophaga flavus]
MKTILVKGLCFITLGLLFNIFFWNEKLGVNLLLFSILLISILLYSYQESLKINSVRISIAFTLLSAIMVVWHNTLISKLVFITSFMIMTGLLHEYRYRTIYNPLAAYIVNFFQVMPNYFNGIQAWIIQSKVKHTQVGRSLAQFRFSFVPLLFFGIFFAIFKTANPIFSDLTDTLFHSFYTLLESLFTNFSIPWFTFFLSGFYLLGSILYYKPFDTLLKHESLQNNWLAHQRRMTKNKLHHRVKNLALKNEYTGALILVISVNILIFAENCADIYWLWINFDYKEITDFSILLHEGANMLLLSILLSMGILLFYFRKNINFYTKNTLLKQAAYLWIIQNGILGLSVLLRCYYYFHEHGLAYKRVGVVIFLILTYIGLFTLYQKISQKKSFFYLLRINSWAAYAMFILLTLINWDVFIVSYNLQHPKLNSKIDLEYQLTRSDKALPILVKNRTKIQDILSRGKIHDSKRNQISMNEYLYYRIEKFQKEYQEYTWLSWNYADYQAYQYFNSRNQ